MKHFTVAELLIVAVIIMMASVLIFVGLTKAPEVEAHDDEPVRVQTYSERSLNKHIRKFTDKDITCYVYFSGWGRAISCLDNQITE